MRQNNFPPGLIKFFESSINRPILNLQTAGGTNCIFACHLCVYTLFSHHVAFEKIPLSFGNVKMSLPSMNCRTAETYIYTVYVPYLIVRDISR